MDFRSAAIMIQILNLMAIADGNVAPEEEELLDDLSQRYLKDASIPSWAVEFNHPDHIEKLVTELHEDHRLLTAKLAYMVIASSREDYQFSVNHDERLAFDRLCNALEIDDNCRAQLIDEAKRDLLKRPSLWEILYSNLPSGFINGNANGPF